MGTEIKTLTAKDTTDYLSHVYEIEKSLYEQKQIMEQLNGSVYTIDQQLGLEPQMEYEKKMHLSDSIVQIILMFAIAAFLGYEALSTPKSRFASGSLFDGLLYGVREMLTEYAGDLRTVKGTLLWIGGFFALLGVLKAVITAVKFFRTRLYNNRVREANQNTMEEYRCWREKLCDKKEAISTEYNILKEESQQTEAMLEKFYSANIIFPKYRTLPAISSLFEYMLSERCYGLSGHEGAYNLYESELRMGHIINSLESISSDLKGIKENQRYLYDVMSETADLTGKLLEQQKVNGKILHDIRQGNEVLQYNTTQIENRLEHIQWMEEQKFIFE